MSKKVEGKSFSSNTTKLLKHLDKLKIIQEKKPPRPIMAHISLINACNLTCSFCCFANRDLTERLPFEKVKQALDSFKKIGITGVEFTGGGEPTLHPKFPEIIKYAYDLGFAIGMNTNGKILGKKGRVDSDILKMFSWVRLGMYGFYENYDYNLSAFEGTDTTISACYIWDENLETSNNPNITGEWTDKSKKLLSKNFQNRENFLRMLTWVEDKKIPTRIAFNAIKKVNETYKDIDTIREILKEFVAKRGKPLQYAFLSDFNFKGERRNDHCYIQAVKPFLFTDGHIYVCPSAELSLENNYNYVPSSQFMVCDIDGIEEYYSKPIERRHHGCHYCKYAMQNELIDDLLTETDHNEFA